MRTLARSLAPALVAAFGMVVLAALLPGFRIDGGWSLVLAVLAVWLVNALVWPALRWVVAPLGVVTLGLGAIVANALVVWAALGPIDGVEIDTFGTALALTFGLAVVSWLATSVFAVHDEQWFDRHTAQRLARVARRRGTEVPDGGAPGLVIVQLDGLAKPVLERAIRSGDAPAIARMLSEGSHRLHPWTPEWSCQTGVSQCGILHGDVTDMPAFRWYERSTGRVLVSNHPRDAAEIERRHGGAATGLLAHHGSSYGNLFSGGAERAVLTMSVIAATKEGTFAGGYRRYFAQPYQAVRTAGALLAEIRRERVAARDQRRRDVRPRVERPFSYSLLRAFTTVVSRDVSLAGVLEDMAEGRSVIYVDFLGYDEVAHHSGPEREDTLRVVRGLDRDLARIGRARQWCRRRYELVVLSDHGQTQGATFADRYGERLEELVARCTGGAATGRDHDGMAETESTAMLAAARGKERTEDVSSEGAVVLASGNLALVSLPSLAASGSLGRLTRQQIDAAHPDLLPTLVGHPGIGFVLVHCAEHGDVVVGPRGERRLTTGEVVGEDPLARFGPHALTLVTRVTGYGNLPDVMVNSLIDDFGEVAAFEDQVSSHGGLGGPQTEPFLMAPVTLSEPALPLVGPVAVHHQLRRWLAELGQPVSCEPATPR